MEHFDNLNPYNQNFKRNELIIFLQNIKDKKKFSDIEINKKMAFQIFEKLLVKHNDIVEPRDIVKIKNSLYLWKKLVESQ